MKSWKNTKGMTLAEVLVAMSIFAVISVVASSILMEVVRMEKRSSVQNTIYQDAQIILQMLTNEIQSGTIDYEEYFSINVVQYDEPLDSNVFYGTNYGVYASRFYDPGLSLRTPVPPISNPTDLGTECSYPIQDPPLPVTDPSCEVRYNPSRDRNSGENPFSNNGLGNYTQANALCDGNGTRGRCNNEGPVNHVNELYLIDSSGTEKTIIARRRGVGTDDWVLGLMRMEGHDFDQNGIIDTFICAEEFNCLEDENAIYNKILDYDFISAASDITDFGIRVPQKSDLTDFRFPADEVQFVGISPLRSNIEELKFIINPIEDPYKAYGETEFQSQPTVTVIMTLGLSEETAADYPGDFEPITVQTTVAAGVVRKIDSYPPTNDLTWLKNLGLYNWPL